MDVARALMPELEAMAGRASPERRALTVTRLTDLFRLHASQFRAEHVEIFDVLLSRLVPGTEAGTRAQVAQRLAALVNAPAGTIHHLANDDAIAVAGPVLSLSPLLNDDLLIDIARRKGQAHMGAIAGRAQLAEPVTDMLVRRGDRDVSRVLANNAGAQLSQPSIAALIKRSSDDGLLTLAMGKRHDISETDLSTLIDGAPDLIRRRLLSTATPNRQALIAQTMLQRDAEEAPVFKPRDFAQAQADVAALEQASRLNEQALCDYAAAHRYEHCIASLAALSGIDIHTLDRLVLGERADAVLILARALDFDWACARALMQLRLGPARLLNARESEQARKNFAHLTQMTARRILRFWQKRTDEDD